MRKPNITITHDKKRGRWMLMVSAGASKSGKMTRQWFKTQAGAKAEKNRLEVELANHGRAGTHLPPDLATDAARAAEILKPYEMTLTAAAKIVAKIEEQRQGSVTFAELYDAYTMNPKKPKRGATLQNYANTFNNFDSVFGSRPITDTAASQIQNHLDTFTPTAAGNHFRALRAWFNFAVKRKWIASNPILELEIDRPEQREIETLDAAQVRALLTAASKLTDEDKQHGRSIAPYAVLATFCGIRPAELRRLDWSDVNIEDGYATVTATSSKVKRRRVVTIPPAAIPWLRPHARTEGALVPYSDMTFKRRWKTAREAAELYDSWSHDILRHTFCSAHLAYHGDLAKLQIEAGHSSLDMLRDHYLDAMPRKVALKFWQIVPKGAKKPEIITAA